MVIVFVGKFRFIINLNFITIMNRHPLFTRFNRYSDKNTGIAVFITHSEYYPDYAISKLFSWPV